MRSPVHQSKSIIGPIAWYPYQMLDDETEAQAYLLFVGSQFGIFLSLACVLLFHTSDNDASALIGLLLCIFLALDAVLLGNSKSQE